MFGQISAVNERSCSNVKEIEEFINVNNAAWINFIKKRNDEFDKYARYDLLFNLLKDCLAENLMYIPRNVAQDSICMMNNFKKQLYEELKPKIQQFYQQILPIRREHFRVKLDSIDNVFNK